MELKFRAWHKERKLYYKVTRLDFREYLVEFLVEFYNHLDYVYERIDINGVIIEQYTGWKDINGIELYENDIMTVVWSDQLGETQYSRVVVKNPFDYDMEELPYLYHAHEFIYLGNIHESKELLD